MNTSRRTRRLRAFAALAALALNITPAAHAQQQGTTVSTGNRPVARKQIVVRSAGAQEGGAGAQGGASVAVAGSPQIEENIFVASGAEGGTFNFVSSEMSFDRRTIKNAPYSADAITETTQTLPDGNRIVRRTEAKVARDSEGRTRREQILNFVGGFAAGNADAAPRTVFINDPVAGANYILNERDRTARKLPSFKFDYDKLNRHIETIVSSSASATSTSTAKEPNAKERIVIVKESKNGEVTTKEYKGKEADEVIAKIEKDRSVRFERAPGGGVRTTASGESLDNLLIGRDKLKLVDIGASAGGDSANVKRESLGKSNIEGIEAEGTRTTTTIPAGEIGNERPIIITYERWYSAALEAVVMTRRSDPRNGETTYKLTNISRNEPARTLFEVPSDYAVKDSPGNTRFRMILPREEK